MVDYLPTCSVLPYSSTPSCEHLMSMNVSRLFPVESTKVEKRTASPQALERFHCIDWSYFSVRTTQQLIRFVPRSERSWSAASLLLSGHQRTGLCWDTLTLLSACFHVIFMYIPSTLVVSLVQSCGCIHKQAVSKMSALQPQLQHRGYLLT